MDNVHFLFGLVLGAMSQTAILYVGYYLYTQCHKATVIEEDHHDHRDPADWWKNLRKNDLN